MACMYGLYVWPVCMACMYACMYGLCVCVVCMCMYELCTCMTCVCACMYGLCVCIHTGHAYIHKWRTYTHTCHTYIIQAIHTFLIHTDHTHTYMYTGIKTHRQGTGGSVVDAKTKATIFYRCNNMSLNHFISGYRHAEWSNPVAVHSHRNLVRRTHASSSCPSQPKQISIANFVCGNNNQTSKARSRLCKQTNCSTSLNFRLIETSNPQVVLHLRLKKSDEKVCCFAKRPSGTCHQKENMETKYFGRT